MKLYIPDIGELITLEKDWSFPLYAEARNAKLGKILGYEYTYHGENYWTTHDGVVTINAIKMTCTGLGRVFDHARYHEMITSYIKNNAENVSTTIPIQLEGGTILGIDRVYIRKGARAFSSLSFFIKNGKYKGARFWAKLSDINRMEIIAQ